MLEAVFVSVAFSNLTLLFAVVQWRRNVKLRAELAWRAILANTEHERCENCKEVLATPFVLWCTDCTRKETRAVDLSMARQTTQLAGLELRVKPKNYGAN